MNEEIKVRFAKTQAKYIFHYSLNLKYLISKLIRQSNLISSHYIPNNRGLQKES